MQDDDKVKKVKDELNKKYKTKDWDDVVGLFMMPEVTFNPTTVSYDINMSKGITSKLFINLKTGEVRSYWIGKLLKD